MAGPGVRVAAAVLIWSVAFAPSKEGCRGRHVEAATMTPKVPVVAVVVIIVVVEASAPNIYPRVTLASASTLSGSVVRTLRGGEVLPKMFYLVASSLGHLRSQCSIVCGSSF